MGVYINGLKIPPSGQYVLVLTSSGMVEDVNGFVLGEAVEVKEPHGRLIDADALCENGTADVHEDMVCDGYVEDSTWGFSRDTILREPVIIEAEGKDDG